MDAIVAQQHLKQLVSEHGKPCGECQECCFTMKIVAVEKPPMTLCKHQCAAGCAINHIKPPECKNYFCEWKYGDIAQWPLPDSCRPDRCGLILSPEPMPDGDVMLCVYETRPGALKTMPEEIKTKINREAISSLIWLIPVGTMGSKTKTKLWKNVYQLEPEQPGIEE